MTESKLFLPSRLIDELAEEQVRQRMQAMESDRPVNFWGSLTHQFGSVLGVDPQKETLLREAQQGWSAIANRAIADRFASLEPQVYVEETVSSGTTEDVVLDDHPMKLLLDNPGPIFDKYTLQWLTAWYLKASGEAYWQKIRDSAGVLTMELWPLPPHRVTPVPDEDEIIKGYAIHTTRGTIALGREDVVRFWTPNPVTLYESLGVFAPNRSEWLADRWRIEHLREHFRNDATPRVAIVGDKDFTHPSPDDQKEFHDQWRALYHSRKGSDRGLPAFVPPGYKPHEFQEQEYQNSVELGRQWDEQFLAMYGVPASIVGLVRDVNRSNAETNRFVFDLNTILPLAMLSSSSLTTQLAMDYDPNLKMRFEPFVAPDKEFDLKEQVAHVEAKIRSIDEVRVNDLGLEEAEWGAFPPGTFGDQPYTGDIPEPSGGGLFPDESVEDLRSESVTSLSQRAYVGMVRTDVAFDPDAAWQRNIDIERSAVSTFQRRLGQIWLLQLTSTMTALESTDLSERIHSTELFNQFQWDEAFASLARLLQEIMNRTSDDTLNSLQRAEKFVPFETINFDLQREQVSLMIRGVNRTTQRRIEQQLRISQKKKEGVRALTKRLNKVFKDRRRARTVAGNEIRRAAQAGTYQGFLNSGMVATKRWNTARDPGVRDSHRIDGQVVTIESTFTLNSGRSARFPLDPQLPAEDSVNCRCFLTTKRF